MVVNDRVGEVQRRERTCAALDHASRREHVRNVPCAAGEHDLHTAVQGVKQRHARAQYETGGSKERFRIKRAARVDQFAAVEIQPLGGKRAAGEHERGGVAVRREQNVLAAQRDRPVQHQRGDWKRSTAAAQATCVGDGQRALSGDEYAVKALQAGVFRATAVERAVSGDIEPQDAALGCAQIRNGAVLGFDGAGVISFAVPENLIVGAHALRSAVRELRELHAFSKGVVLAYKIRVAAIRKAHGDDAARSVTGAFGARIETALFWCTGRFRRVEPDAADLGQVLGAQPGLHQHFPFRSGQGRGVVRLPRTGAAGEQKQQREQECGRLFHGGVLQIRKMWGYFISSATRSV